MLKEESWSKISNKEKCWRRGGGEYGNLTWIMGSIIMDIEKIRMLLNTLLKDIVSITSSY